MQDCYEINPQSGIAYKSGEASLAPPAIIPDKDLLHLSLSELHAYTGDDGSRIIMSIDGELLDISAGRELYGPGCGYSLFAGRDVTKCLGSASLDTDDLDQLEWRAESDEDKEMLNNWLEKLKAKYPVAGSLKRDSSNQAVGPLPFGMIGPPEGLRQRAPTASSSSAPAKETPAPVAPTTAAASSDSASDKCPISGKEGIGCPMAMFAGGAKPKAKAAPKSEAAGAKTGFMAGKSMIAHVNESKDQGESWIYKLCPLHWDTNTTRLLITVASAAWVSGIFVGWNLHRQWLSWMAPAS